MAEMGTMRDTLQNIPMTRNYKKYGLDTNIRHHENQTSRNKLPPLVVPEKHPREIMQELLTKTEYDDVKKCLIAYRKSGVWAAMPDLMQEKWVKCLETIRRNGYIYPQVIKDTIVFSQILTYRKHNADQCTTCTNRMDRDQCSGRKATTNNPDRHIKRGDFIPCWK